MSTWWRTLCALLLMLCAYCANAQPDPLHPQPDVPDKKGGLAVAQRVLNELLAAQQTSMTLAPQGLFVLRNGILLKLDAKTLRKLGTVDLFGAMPERQPGNAEAERLYYTEMVRRLLPAAVVLNDTDLLAVVGEQYFRIDTASLTVKVNRPLGLPFALDAKHLRSWLVGVPPAPSLLVNEHTLYISQPDEVIACNIQDGAVQAHGPLPLEMQPLFQTLAKLPNGKQPKGQQALNDPQPMTVVGTLIQHEENGGFWVIKNDNAEEYVLGGDELPLLTATKNIADRRVRVTGTYSQRADVVQYGRGYLEITKYQVLGG